MEIVFDTGANDAVSINCLFGGWGRATGTAWFDDLALELISARPMSPKAEIDAKHDLRSDLQIHLRPVHRASRPLHLPGHLGRDAGGPEILLPRRRPRIAVESRRRSAQRPDESDPAVRRRSRARNPAWRGRRSRAASSRKTWRSSPAAPIPAGSWPRPIPARFLCASR